MADELQIVREISGTFELMVELEIIKTERDAHLGRTIAMIKADGSGYNYNLFDTKDLYIKKFKNILKKFEKIKEKARKIKGITLSDKVMSIMKINKRVIEAQHIMEVLIDDGNLDITNTKISNILQIMKRNKTIATIKRGGAVYYGLTTWRVGGFFNTLYTKGISE